MVRDSGGETDPALHTGKAAKLSWGRRHLLWEKGMTFLFENSVQQGVEGVVLGSPGGPGTERIKMGSEGTDSGRGESKVGGDVWEGCSAPTPVCLFRPHEPLT